MIFIFVLLLGVPFFTVSSFTSTEVITIPTNTAQHVEGERIYRATCVKCHNKDPHLKGSLGPDLYTTPKEVFNTKVITGTYPEGYAPKRKTRIMPKFSHLTNDIDKVYNYIRSFKKEKK